MKLCLDLKLRHIFLTTVITTFIIMITDGMINLFPYSQLWVHLIKQYQENLQKLLIAVKYFI